MEFGDTLVRQDNGTNVRESGDVMVASERDETRGNEEERGLDLE
jgi:hypothetical protein